MNRSVSQHIRKECTVNGLSNTLFNGVIAWLLLKGGAHLTLGGENSFAVDLIATGFILPFIVTLIIIPLNKRQLDKQAVLPVSLDRNDWRQNLLLKFPTGLFQRALVFGLIGMLLLAPMTLLPLWLLGVEQFSPVSYAIFKGVWAGAIAALLAIPMILLALQQRRK